MGRIVGESAALLFTAGAAEVIAQNVVKAYTSNGATLSVLLYLRAFEDGDFDSAWAIGAVLLVLGFRTLRRENKPLGWCYKLALAALLLRGVIYVLLALPVELRSILLFGTALIVLIGVIKIIKS